MEGTYTSILLTECLFNYKHCIIENNLSLTKKPNAHHFLSGVYISFENHFLAPPPIFKSYFCPKVTPHVAGYSENLKRWGGSGGGEPPWDFIKTLTSAFQHFCYCAGEKIWFFSSKRFCLISCVSQKPTFSFFFPISFVSPLFFPFPFFPSFPFPFPFSFPYPFFCLGL